MIDFDRVKFFTLDRLMCHGFFLSLPKSLNMGYGS